MKFEVPNRKPTVYLVSGAVMTIAFGLSREYLGYEPDADTAVALANLVGFGLAYFVREKPSGPV